MSVEGKEGRITAIFCPLDGGIPTITVADLGDFLEPQLEFVSHGKISDAEKDLDEKYPADPTWFNKMRELEAKRIERLMNRRKKR